MSFKRATWTSGYTYNITCEYCRTVFSYTDRQLDYRPWYTNGFIYCPRCRKPLRHSEFYAVFPDGTPVYKTRAEADAAVRTGYYESHGMAAPAGTYPTAPAAPAATAANASATAAAGSASASPAAVDPDYAFCPACGRRYRKGNSKFCTGCGRKLPEPETPAEPAATTDVPAGETPNEGN